MTTFPVTEKTADYTLVAGDTDKELQFNKSTAVTATLPAAGTAGNGYSVVLRNIGDGDLTVAANGAETIDGEASVLLKRNQWCWLSCNGSLFRFLFLGPDRLEYMKPEKKTDDAILSIFDAGTLQMLDSATTRTFTLPDLDVATAYRRNTFAFKNLGAGELVLKGKVNQKIDTAENLSVAQGGSTILVADRDHTNWRSLSGISGTAQPALSTNYSCRFNSVDNAYLNKTFTGAGNRDTWTYSCWVKRSKFGVDQQLLTAGADASNFTGISFSLNDYLRYEHQDGGARTDDLVTSQVFRDPSAWYHIVVAVDTTNATEANRIRFYVNGTEVTNFGTANYPAQNVDTDVGMADEHRIGSRVTDGVDDLDGYMSQVAFVDGTALDANSFGEQDSNGVWRPKDISGLTFGTNGFYLDFADSADLGKDVSGTPTSLFTSSGLGTNDQVTDTPTNNYSTLNPIDHDDGTFSEANLKFTRSSGDDMAVGSIGISDGKWYFEATTLNDVANKWIGVTDFTNTGSRPWASVPDSYSYAYAPLSGNSYKNEGTSSNASYGAAASTNDVIMCAIDLTGGSGSGKIWFGKNGTWLNSGDPEDGSNAAYTDMEWPSGHLAAAAWVGNVSSAWGMNFGQLGFAHTVPNGYKALATANLPQPASAATVTPLTGSFTGNAATDGPFVYLGYTPDTSGTSTINSNTITWGTHARPTANGFKVISSSASYNASGSNTYSIAVEHPFGGENTTPVTAR